MLALLLGSLISKLIALCDKENVKTGCGGGDHQIDEPILDPRLEQT